MKTENNIFKSKSKTWLEILGFHAFIICKERKKFVY